MAKGHRKVNALRFTGTVSDRFTQPIRYFTIRLKSKKLLGVHVKITAYYCVSFINVTFTYKKAMSHEISHENNHRICSTSETIQSTRYRPAAS